MANVQRFYGSADGVVNVDVNLSNDQGTGALSGNVLISTGIGKHPTAYKILSGNAETVGSGLTSEAQMGVGGAVETILRTFAQKGTILAYQTSLLTSTSSQVSLLVEATGWGTTDLTGTVTATADADFTAALQALGNRAANTAIPVTAYDFGGMTAVSTGGIKLA